MYAWSKSKAIASLAVALGAASSALAHGGVFYYTYAGATYQGVTAYNTLDGQVSIQRPWYTYDPIQNSEGATIACNNYGESLPGSGQQTATVKAGTAITAWWNPWGHNVGPMFTYLAQCPGSTCTGVNSTSLKWFKIDQAGLLSGTVGQGFWGSGQMMAQNSSWTTTIPATVPSGNYLIRFETIALHLLPAQHYPECAQITITGGGTLAPTAAQLVTFPGGYKNTDPGLTVDIYSAAAQTQTTYIIPGPPLYGSGSGSSSSSSSTKPASSSTVAPSTTKSTTTVVSTTKPATTSTTVSTTKTSSSAAPSTTGTVAQYGQCGGSGYTGPTVCVAPYTCTKANDFYSQCL